MADEPDMIFCKTESVKDRIQMLKENAVRKDLLTKGETQLEKLRKNNPNYGKPVEGSKTAVRGHIAHARVAEEVRGLCQIIKDYGKPCDDGTYFIFFGELFNIYTHISDKVVGLLLRARKYGFVEFIGETLFQRQDDFIPIRLIRMPGPEFKFDY